MPQHIRMGKGSARLPKFPEGIRFKGSEERPAEIGEARQLVVTKVAGEYFCSIAMSWIGNCQKKARVSGKLGWHGSGR